MKTVLLKLYKVTWKHTANSYVVCKEWDKEVVLKEIEKSDERCDDIVGIEEVSLPAFDGDDMRKNNYIRLFVSLDVL